MSPMLRWDHAQFNAVSSVLKSSSFWTRRLTFSFCTGPHKLCSQSYLPYLQSLKRLSPFLPLCPESTTPPFLAFIFMKPLSRLPGRPCGRHKTILSASCGGKNETEVGSGCAILTFPFNLFPAQELPAHFPERSLLSVNQHILLLTAMESSLCERWDRKVWHFPLMECNSYLGGQ